MQITNITTLSQLTTYIISLLDPKSIDEIRKCKDEKEFTGIAHHGFGMWLRNNLELWVKGSHLYNFFKDTYGLLHADDMSGILLPKLYKTLKGDYNDDWIAAEIEHYRQHWAKSGSTEQYVIDPIKKP